VQQCHTSFQQAFGTSMRPEPTPGGRELSINLRCRTNKEYALVPGNLTCVKQSQRGGVAGYRISEEGTGVRPYEGSSSVRCSNLKGESRMG
jgi:hypothetical protein